MTPFVKKVQNPHNMELSLRPQFLEIGDPAPFEGISMRTSQLRPELLQKKHLCQDDLFDLGWLCAKPLQILLSSIYGPRG
jgi:hypothetical protein